MVELIIKNSNGKVHSTGNFDSTEEMMAWIDQEKTREGFDRTLTFAWTNKPTQSFTQSVGDRQKPKEKSDEIVQKISTLKANLEKIKDNDVKTILTGLIELLEGK